MGDDAEDDDGAPAAHASKLESGWRFWSEVKAFCEQQAVPISHLMVDLDFSVLARRDRGPVAEALRAHAAQPLVHL